VLCFSAVKWWGSVPRCFRVLKFGGMVGDVIGYFETILPGKGIELSRKKVIRDKTAYDGG
jgi:hypothetical protein